MYTRPGTLTDADIASALSEHWHLATDDVSYLPVGFGSHHWRVEVQSTRWFVTVDDLASKRRVSSDTNSAVSSRLTAALTVAYRLRQAGNDFVVAPILSRHRRVLERLDNDRFALAVYPYVEGKIHDFEEQRSETETTEILECLVAVHRAPADIIDLAGRDDFLIPRRDELVDSFGSDHRPWGPGPFAARAQHLLATHRDAMADALEWHRRLVAMVAGRPERMVLTHGEPHIANTITTADGVRLIDWDTALVAPPERDLWMLAADAPDIVDAYEDRTNQSVDPDALALYRLRWDLSEISSYTAEFRAPHDDTTDTGIAWASLKTYLDPSRWADR